MKRIRSYICTRESIGESANFLWTGQHSQFLLQVVCCFLGKVSNTKNAFPSLPPTARPILSPLLDAARLRCTALYGLKFGPSNLHCTQSSSDCHPTDTTRIGQSPGSICHRLEGFQQPFAWGRNQANILNCPAS